MFPRNALPKASGIASTAPFVDITLTKAESGRPHQHQNNICLWYKIYHSYFVCLQMYFNPFKALIMMTETSFFKKISVSTNTGRHTSLRIIDTFIANDLRSCLFLFSRRHLLISTVYDIVQASKMKVIYLKVDLIGIFYRSGIPTDVKWRD